MLRRPPRLLCWFLLWRRTSSAATGDSELKIHVVAYDDGPDYGALVQFRDSETVEVSFLEESSTVDAPFPPGNSLEPAGLGLGAGFGGAPGSQDPPQDFLPKQAERLMKNQCCNPDGCCGQKPDANVERGSIFLSTDEGLHPVDTLLDVRSSFLETDALGRTVQVNKVCCGGAANAGGAGPGGDQFAAASVPAVPCVCTLLADQTAATSSG